MANTHSPQAAGTDRPVTVSVPTAARVLGFGEATIYRALRRGDIPCVRVGRAVRVRVEWLEQQLGQPVDTLLGASDKDREQTNA